ncbi:hypothetical protein N7528_000599 [Penicillium herquei]|nr:hypothetical protein N7528_000599 [Penicillium herquei]
MSGRTSDYVLRCVECNKPFDKESSLKRHGYYCRSSKISAFPKSVSCTVCARRKVRCDKMKPECSRCKVKGLECRYITSFQNQLEENSHDVTNGDSAVVALENDVANTGVPSNLDITDIVFNEFLNPEINKSLQEPFMGWGLFADHETIFDHTHSVNWSIPSQPTSNPRSLNQRPKSRLDAQRTVSLIQHTLKSYLLTMLRQSTLPPFIHPNQTSTSSEMEALDNCISLVHMMSSGTRGSHKLFWRNVRIECERLCSEAWQLSRWGLLAAMQSVSIYILFRLDEGETEHNDFDSLLLNTVTIIAQCLTQKDIAKNYSREQNWRDWLYEESRRRLAVIYRVVNMLVYFDPASMCNLPSDLVLAPLPARKGLWEASDEQSWVLENKKDHAAGNAFGLARTGELVRLGRDCDGEALVHSAITSTSPLRTGASWEEWCSGMDGFGGLIMLAALLVEE